MRSSTRWFTPLLLLFLAASTGTLVAQAPDGSLHDDGSKATEVSAQASAKGNSANSVDEQNADTNREPAKSAATPSAAPQSADEQSSETRSSALAVKASKVNWHLGTIFVGAGYSSGPVYWPYGYSPFGPYPGDWVYSSFAYPLWGPYPFYPAGSFVYTSGRGEVRLQADPKQAEVYIDGAYAGTADRLKSMWLDPGAYDLTVSFKDRESFRQRIYVLSGKSLKITARLGSGIKERL